MTQKLYVHCGLHKTGTTALQSALRASGETLDLAGFDYPHVGTLDQPGRPSGHPSDSAHHNLSWEILQKRLFDARNGTLNDAKNYATTNRSNLIFSSEEFGCLLHQPASFAPLQQIAHKTGRELILIVYLRNQLDYCDALYQELLKHDRGTDYQRHADLILSTGSLPYRDVLHHFDYETILASWRAVNDIGLVVRNYHDLVGGSIVDDFKAILGLEGKIAGRADWVRANTRETMFESLRRFYENRTRRRSSRIEKLRMAHLSRGRTHFTASSAMQEKFVERFQAANLRLASEWKIPSNGLDFAGYPKTESNVTLQQFFSFQTHRAISTGTVPTHVETASGLDRTDWMTGIETVDHETRLSDRARYWIGEAARNRRWYSERAKMAVSALRPIHKAASADKCVSTPTKLPLKTKA